jgi:F-type H+-transporting ATPase subunit epsilon
VQLVSPEQILFQGEGKMVVVRTLGGGDIAFEDNHAPFLGALADWPARVKFEDGTQAWFAVHGGFVEVSHNQVIILSDVAEPADGIDVTRATDAKARAEEALRANDEDDEASAALARASVRLEVAASA